MSLSRITVKHMVKAPCIIRYIPFGMLMMRCVHSLIFISPLYTPPGGKIQNKAHHKTPTKCSRTRQKLPPAFSPKLVAGNTSRPNERAQFTAQLSTSHLSCDSVAGTLGSLHLVLNTVIPSLVKTSLISALSSLSKPETVTTKPLNSGHLYWQNCSSSACTNLARGAPKTKIQSSNKVWNASSPVASSKPTTVLVGQTVSPSTVVPLLGGPSVKQFPVMRLPKIWH